MRLRGVNNMLTGIDILDVVRMEKFLQNEHFLERYFTPYEITYVNNTHRKTQTLAGMYCAKEAFLKAIGIGLFNGIELNEIEVHHEPSGKPYIILSDRAKLVTMTKGIKDIQISISHTDEICTAICILN